MTNKLAQQKKTKIKVSK